MIKTAEITYNQAADVLGCSPRNVRRILRRNKIKPIVRGHRTVRLPMETIVRLKMILVMKAGKMFATKPRSGILHSWTPANGIGNGKGRR